MGHAPSAIGWSLRMKRARDHFSTAPVFGTVVCHTGPGTYVAKVANDRARDQGEAVRLYHNHKSSISSTRLKVLEPPVSFFNVNMPLWPYFFSRESKLRSFFFTFMCPVASFGLFHLFVHLTQSNYPCKPTTWGFSELLCRVGLPTLI